MSSLVQSRSPQAPAVVEPQVPAASQKSIDSAFSAGAAAASREGHEPLTPAALKALEQALTPKDSSAALEMAQETIRTLDNGSFAGIATADRVASLEIARRTVSEENSRLQQVRQAVFPAKAMEGFNPTEFIQRLLSDLMTNGSQQLLSSKRNVSVRSARDSLAWLLKGMQAVTATAAALLGSGPSNNTTAEGEKDRSGLNAGERAALYEAAGLQCAPDVEQASRESSKDDPRRKVGLRLLPEDTGET